MPHFLYGTEEGNLSTFADLIRSFVDRIDEYEALDHIFRRDLSFQEHIL